MKSSSIAIIIELSAQRTVAAVSRECLHMGRKIADTLGCELAAIVLGSSIDAAAVEATCYDTDIVYAIEHSLLEGYEPELYLAAFLHSYEIYRPAGILMGHSLFSQDLAPRIACTLGAGLVMDATGFEFTSGEMLFIKPVYSGNVIAHFSVDTEPFVTTIRPKSEGPALFSSERRGKLVSVPVAIDRSLTTIEVVERVHEDNHGMRLQNADVIVAGGRGMGGPEGFDALADLAGVLGGTVGSSRPPCDLGWIPPSTQIGQTGEIVKPDLYIAVGISGSTQHITGMAGAKTVIAINTDPGANIFRIADYGLIADYHEAIPAFTESLREIIGERDT
ncbi:MAG: electron transfer flavoprotein subunit alpha/FixB family protein [Deltaproteobacteria bacterium]|nr:electron transfer flavoprotein subunit alpha/FixB family protein [Deltaproteobacteria bacterium]